MALCCKKKKGGGGGLQFLAAQTLKIASMNGLGELDKLESELEDEINYESQAPPNETIQKLRHKVEHFLHCKPVLLAVVILNVIDCLLVLGELTFDFNHIGKIIDVHNKVSIAFLASLETQYPNDLHGVSNYPVVDIYGRILDAHVIWSGVNDTSAMCFANDTNSNQTILNRHRRSSSGGDGDDAAHGEGHSIEEELGHGFHLASIAILTLLVFIVVLKVASTVPRFFRSKMQVFDSVVIVISFTIDLVFIEGVMSMAISNYVIILTFLLPWRIIRILNSLIVAVLDKQRFQMKLLYKQKKKVDKQYQEINERYKNMLKQMEMLRDICIDKGVPIPDIKKAFENEKHGKKNKALGKLAFHSTPSPSTKHNTLSPMSNGNASFLNSNNHSTSTPNLAKENLAKENGGHVTLDIQSSPVTSRM